ncbi:3'-5' exonuclease [Aureibaculum algae]|uniref:3'-5' exonuclease n=1 Tax=Aureibaculum algae TaxID=2584122 RepID=A0A5B7TPC5_9FLAO|nr:MULTISPECIES: 3'-5' exonuclease [Aureibaculum]QCX36996.1 3'-5' exonuclease [Aureibaculum algae]
MLNKIKLENILFLDIETVPEVATFAELSDLKKELFAKKTEYQRKNEISVEDFYDRAGIWAEFGKIICISVGYFVDLDGNRNFRLTSFSGDEKQLLIDFKQLLDNHFNKDHHLLCAHNGKEFDFPYIARRMIINSVPLPSKLNLFGKKPWEVAHLDTLELWKFGDYKHYTSLNLLTNILGIPSPKQDIDGSQVANVFYEEHDLDRIVKYCERDTLAVAQLLLRFNNLELLQEDEIVTIPSS